MEEKRLDENWEYKQISEWLEKQYNEKITPAAIGRHFRKHVMENVDQAIRSEVKTKEIAKEEVADTLNLIEELKTSIGVLKKMLNRVMEQDETEITSAQVNAVTSLFSEIRLTIKELNKLTGQLEISEINEENARDEFFSRFASELKPSVAKEVVEAWERVNEREGGEENGS